jgi:hypothetical protein
LSSWILDDFHLRNASKRSKFFYFFSNISLNVVNSFIISLSSSFYLSLSFMLFKISLYFYFSLLILIFYIQVIFLIIFNSMPSPHASLKNFCDSIFCQPEFRSHVIVKMTTLILPEIFVILIFNLSKSKLFVTSQLIFPLYQLALLHSIHFKAWNRKWS